MTDEKGNILRSYSQDRHTYRDNSLLFTRRTSTQFVRKSETYYSNRNCPEILSIFHLTDKNLQDRKHNIYHSVSSDAQYFNMINYPIKSRSPSPLHSLDFDINEKQDMQIKFPKVTPRVKYYRTNKKPFYSVLILSYSYLGYT